MEELKLIGIQNIKKATLWDGFLCPGQDSNLHAFDGASPSSWYVYQFHHLGIILCKSNKKNNF